MKDYLKDIQKDVDEMNKVFDEGVVRETNATEAPTTEAPKVETDPPSTEAPKTEAPGTEAPGTESPKTEAPKTEAPTTEVPETDAEVRKRLEKENEELRKRIDESYRPKPKTEEPKTSAPKTAAPTTEVPKEVDFLGDEDPEDLIRDPKKFNALLNKIRSSAIEDGKKLGVESVLRSIPDIVKTNIVAVGELTKARDKFYEDNEDLRPFNKVVAAVFEEVAAKNPDKKFDELFKEVASESRKRLELHKKIVNKDRTNHPNLPHKKPTKRQSQTGPNLSGIEKEISEMDEALT